MIKTLLPTAFYFYLIFDFSFNEPIAYILLQCLWYELFAIITAFTILKFLDDGISELGYLIGIVVGFIPILAFLYSLIQTIPVELSITDEVLSVQKRNGKIGVAISQVISVALFIWSRSSESAFVMNTLTKLITVSILVLTGVFIVGNLESPNNMTIVYSIIAMRVLIEIMLNTKFFKKLKS